MEAHAQMLRLFSVLPSSSSQRVTAAGHLMNCVNTTEVCFIFNFKGELFDSDNEKYLLKILTL